MAPSNAKRILIAEDTKSIRNILAFMLKSHGYEVFESSDGDDALEKAIALLPDLLVLDVMMPGKTGFEICSILKGNEAYRNIRILILTAATRDSGKSDAHWKRISNADDFISKPFKALDMVERIEKLLGRKGPAEPETLKDKTYEITSDSDEPGETKR
jgi:two-component system alkaline phosphatase synthesis response regulator PhoP